MVERFSMAWLAILGTLLLPSIFGYHQLHRENLSQYPNGELCKIEAAQKMLRSLGISSSKTCLLQNKRDIAHLVTSYLYPEYNKQLASLKRGLDDSFEGSNVRRGWRQHSNENDMKVMEDFDQVFGDHTITKRARNYCCSPDCNPFMKNLDWPNPGLINCEEK